MSANLDRIQIIGQVDDEGQSHECIIDVAWSASVFRS